MIETNDYGTTCFANVQISIQISHHVTPMWPCLSDQAQHGPEPAHT